jgi:ribonuclease HI
MWCQANRREPKREVIPRHPLIVEWTKPPLGTIKLNWDASIDKVRNRMGVGVIARDHNGQAIAMFCSTKGGVQDPTMAEAVAVWEAVELAHRLGLRSLVLEGDALEIVQMLKKDGECGTIYGQLVNAAKESLRRWQGWEIQHVSRSANNAAHHLAKLALEQNGNREWTDGFPSRILDIVCAEYRL